MNSQKKSNNLLRGYKYPGVAVCSIAHDGNGQILLMKRSERARDEHGRWDICGGALEFGERIEDAIDREVTEELCVKPVKVEFLTAYEAHRSHLGKKTHWIALLHSVLVDVSNVKIGEPEKFDAIGWFHSTNLPGPLHSQFPKALDAAKKAGIIR